MGTSTPRSPARRSGVRTARSRPTRAARRCSARSTFLDQPDHRANNTTAIAIRYGYNRFLDDGTNFAGGFDAASLGYPSSYTSLLAENAYPSITMTGYSNIGHGGRSVTTHVGQTANIAVSKFMGKHSLKYGGRLPADRGADVPRPATVLRIHPGLHAGSEPDAATRRRDASPASCLAMRAAATSTSCRPGLLHRLYSSFIQDDFRFSSKVTVNYGLR